MTATSNSKEIKSFQLEYVVLFSLQQTTQISWPLWYANYLDCISVSLSFIAHLPMLSVVQMRTIGWLMNNWLQMNRGKRAWPIFAVVAAFHWRDWRKSRIASSRIVDIPAEIRTEHFPNTSQKHYLFSRFARQSLCSFGNRFTGSHKILLQCTTSAGVQNISANM
jgi:hypothetical protein